MGRSVEPKEPRMASKTNLKLVSIVPTKHYLSEEVQMSAS